jgi:plastocyanin
MTTRISRLAAARFTLGIFAVTFATAVLLPPTDARAATVAVAVEDFDFSPASRTIKVGDVVHWSFSGSSHSVTSRDGLFDSGITDPGGSFQFTFTKAGTFRYYCVVHPGLMSGTIVVEGDSATPVPTVRPTATPTPRPTPTPTARPTDRPSAKPTAAPTEAVASPSAPASPTGSLAPTESPAASEAIVSAPEPSSTPAAPAPSPSDPANASDSTPIVAGGVLLAVIVVGGGGWLLARRRRAS